VAGEYLVATRGMRGPLLAVKLSQLHEGKLTNRVIEWTQQTGTPDSCSPAIWADLVFTVTDDGIARCYNGFSGRKWWETRLKGKYKASPITGENRVYFLNEDGLCTVVAASTYFQKLVENQIDDQTIASPAAAGKQIFLRGRKWLYCVGQ
jgi:outer membrane protein assembly factor BamB